MNSSAQPNSCEFRDNHHILAEQPLFAGLGPEIMKVLAYVCVRKTYMAGEVINRVGESSKGMGLVLCGEVDLRFARGSAETTLYTMGAGYFFGVLACLGQMRHHTSLVAAKDVTKCLLLPRDKLERTLARYPESYAILNRNLASGIHEWESAQLLRFAESQPPPECPLTLY